MVPKVVRGNDRGGIGADEQDVSSNEPGAVALDDLAREDATSDGATRRDH